MIIRDRRADDLDACVAIMEKTHLGDGYPKYRQDNTTAFLAPTGELAAWVAEHEGRVVGHVAVHPAATDPTFPVAHRATGRDADRLSVLARLVVDPDTRGLGVGRALIATVLTQERSRDRLVVLDVLKESTGAVAFYDRLGWRRIGATEIPVPGQPPLDVWVYLAPEA